MYSIYRYSFLPNLLRSESFILLLMKYVITQVKYCTEEGILMVECDSYRVLYTTDNLSHLRGKLHAAFPCRNIYFIYYEIHEKRN